MTDRPTMIGTTILLTAYLEEALKRIDQIERQKVPYEAKRLSVGIVLERLYTQLEPERLNLIREPSAR